MPANVIDFTTALIYGDMGNAELGVAAPPLPAGQVNHLRWTIANKPNSPSTTITGTQFLVHHLDFLLARYEAWRSKYFLPPLRPWDGQNVFPDNVGSPPVGPLLPGNLNGSPFPAGMTLNSLGTEIRNYYNALRHFNNGGDATELNQDEIKAPFSYRYWALMKWASDLRKRLTFVPVLPVYTVYDKDGTILTDKDFTDVFHQVHHVWHPNGVGTAWTTPTPYFSTSVGQHRRKKEISRTQVGAEFFTFHHDHMEIYDRWLARTGQIPAPSLNTCAHDTAGTGSPPAGIETDASGFPHVQWNLSATNPPVELNPTHTTYWNGTLSEFSNLGLMGQRFATDNNPFDGTSAVPKFNPPWSSIPVAGTSDSSYHGTGHVLNGDLIEPVSNNHVPRFFGWHGFIDDLWTKRRPEFSKLEFVKADASAYPSPNMLTVVRDLVAGTDTPEPSNAIGGIVLANGQGTLRVRLNVRPDPFNRPLQLQLRCEVLREAVNNTAVITQARTLTLTTGAPVGPTQRQQGTDFVEDFVFDGSAGAVDAAGDGPFITDNAAFVPTPVGFKNSLIQVTGYLTCQQFPDGTVKPVSGSISTSGTTLTGSGTSFTTQLNQGDLIRANGEVRMVALIGANTSGTLLEPFSSNLPAGTGYERLDGFDYTGRIALPLIQEKRAPAITAYLDRSTFSKDQVQAVASAGTSTFNNSFYVILQDRTSRAANIAWPPEVEPKLRNLIAPPVYGAGLFTDAAHRPSVELKDLSNNVVPGLTVSVGAGIEESPGQHPGIPQRITFGCDVTFTGVTAFGAMVAGDPPVMLKLVITAVDRAGNTVVDDSLRVRLQVNANPYMLDGPTSWLSVDTRVFKIAAGAPRFGVAAGWSNPNTFIAAVIDNLRLGGGTAGGESFDTLPQDQSGSVLEYSTTVNGITFHNFALSKMRLQSLTGATDVRATFRLFRWGVANVEFDNSLAYRSAPSGVALLGRTTTNELASIPFFAAPRVATTADMSTQTDPKNLFSFAATGGGEASSFFGAYLDINQTSVRFPATFVNDGPFAGALQSIRTLMVGNHQCMVVEVFHAPDPTDNGATPGTSDNLSQRNLLIVQTANPGDEITRTVQHAFDIDLTHKRRRRQADDHDHDHDHQHDDRDADRHDHLNPDENCCAPIEVLRPFPPTTHGHEGHARDGVDHLRSGWLAEFPELLARRLEVVHADNAAKAAWQFDPDNWKAGTGVDELAFFWGDLPDNSVVELYLPGLSVTDCVNLRNLRHAPATVKFIDNHTLHMVPQGVTYLPLPPFWGDNLAGLITVRLPAGIKKGQRYHVDVVQMRSDEARVLGGFQLQIQVEKSHDLHEAELRWLELFHQRLSLTARTDRYRPVLEKQVEFTRARARAFTELTNTEDHPDPPLVWTDPTESQRGQKIRVTLEKIQVTDDREPWFKGKGEFRFLARVVTQDNGGQEHTSRFPSAKHFELSDTPGDNEVVIEEIVFEGFVEDDLFVQIGGTELDTFDPDDVLCTYKRAFTGNPVDWLGRYGPNGTRDSIENVGGWNVWYRIEYAG
jgi:hypothetical protein